MLKACPYLTFSDQLPYLRYSGAHTNKCEDNRRSLIRARDTRFSEMVHWHMALAELDEIIACGGNGLERGLRTILIHFRDY